MSDDRDYEVRAKCARIVGQVLEAHSRAFGTDRQDIVNAVLLEWAQRQVHAATLTLRPARSEGGAAE